MPHFFSFKLNHTYCFSFSYNLLRKSALDLVPCAEIDSINSQGVTNINIAGDTQKKNRIQVSNTNKPLFFYVNLAKVSRCTETRFLFSGNCRNGPTTFLVFPCPKHFGNAETPCRWLLVYGHRDLNSDNYLLITADVHATA